MTFEFRNGRAQLRDGWKSCCFLLACMAAFVVVGLIGRALPPGLKAYAPSALLIAVAGLLLSWAAVRLEGKRLASIGLRLDGRFVRQFGLGLLAGALLVAAGAALVCGVAGVQLVGTEPPTLAVQLKIVVMVLCGALFEELLFRGYAFQRAVSGMGRWPAIAVFALLFCLAHLPGNTAVETPVLLIALAGLLLDAVIQSLLFLRTGSLALPIGLHAAWNLLQGMLGFGVSGLASAEAWMRAEPGSQPGWLTGAAYGLEGSVFPLLLQLALLAWLLKTGTAARQASRYTANPA